VKRGLVRLEETAQAFHVTGLQQDGKKFAHEHVLNEAQTEALGRLWRRWRRGVSSAPAVWHHREREDGGVRCGDAAGAGCGQECAAAGAGDWA
jgi:hypothetical protein